MDTFTREMRANFAANVNQEIIIMGAVQLFWKHSKNVSYLNSALQYARGRKGIRVNAVRAFLETFTGAVFHKKDDFVKGGRKVPECPPEFFELDSWLDWADKNAQEPEYNLAKHQLKIVQMFQKEKKLAEENGQDAMAKSITAAMTAYVETQRELMPSAQAS